ncbi:MAG: hypothetical protein FD138_4692, partial [Planctomycetota bacterium]
MPLKTDHAQRRPMSSTIHTPIAELNHRLAENEVRAEF